MSIHILKKVIFVPRQIVHRYGHPVILHRSIIRKKGSILCKDIFIGTRQAAQSLISCGYRVSRNIRYPICTGLHSQR